MSWSTQVKSKDKQEIKDNINGEQMAPKAVKEAISALVDICPDNKIIDVSTYGHHNDGELSTTSIVLNVS